MIHWCGYIIKDSELTNNSNTGYAIKVIEGILTSIAHIWLSLWPWYWSCWYCILSVWVNIFLITTILTKIADFQSLKIDHYSINYLLKFNMPWSILCVFDGHGHEAFLWVFNGLGHK